MLFFILVQSEPKRHHKYVNQESIVLLLNDLGTMAFLSILGIRKENKEKKTSLASLSNNKLPMLFPLLLTDP